MTLQKTSPTVLNNKNEEITSNYILFTLLVSDKGTEESIGMNLVQEELFVYSRTEETNDILVGQNLANTQTIANTVLLFRHYDFYSRGNCAIIGAEKMCSIEVGRKSLVSRPKTRGLNFFEKSSYTAKISGFSILYKIDLCFKDINFMISIFTR